MNNKPELYNALTMKNRVRARTIISPVGISEAFDPVGLSQEQINSITTFDTQALWDTGATNSAISKKTAEQIGLFPSGLANIQHADGISVKNTYLINITLSSNVLITAVKVSECDIITGDFGVIIGMDIISLGDFAFTNLNGKSVFSFRVPSFKTIDFIAERNELLKRIKEIGRNDPCYCGSGIKYKNCHGKN